MSLYPFQLSYVIKTPIWGGTQLLEHWSKQADSPTVGESWELTVRDLEKSKILNGAFAGKALEEVLAEHGKSMISPDYADGRFPLLVKFIDARDTLSVQVHPDDAYATRVEQDRGKTEMWYIVDAEEGAELIFGLQDGVTRDDFAAAITAGESERVLKRQPVRRGESYFIPSGMPHAIGGGILIAEIQQNCDLTYRIYDFNRRQADGSLRELHVQKALDVVRPYSKDEVAALRFARKSQSLANGEVLADCRYFRVEKLVVSGAHTLPSCDKMRHLLCLEGEGVIVYDGQSYPIKKGDSYFLPPLPALEILGTIEALVSSV